MAWNLEKWKFSLKSVRDRWLLLLALGVMFLILAVPGGGPKDPGNGISPEEKAVFGNSSEDDSVEEAVSEEPLPASAGPSQTYEKQLEERLKQILRQVEGVGEVEVMIVLKSTGEQVWQVDQDTSYSVTQETDAGGGTRKVESRDVKEDTILAGDTGSPQPLLKKELRPEISGVVVTAAGGGSPTVQAEIAAAAEALFDIPAHKIKVLKRVQ